MRELFITKKGLLLLGRIMTSCLPTQSKLITTNYEYVAEMVKNCQADIDFGDFVKNLTVSDGKYLQIMALATKFGKNFIDETVVAEFFGGEPHFKSVSVQVESLKEPLHLTEKRAQKIFFSHILIPVVVESVFPVAAVYVNRDLKVVVKGLVSVIRGEEIEPGKKYWVHYSSIVASESELGEEVKRYLLGEQVNDQRFVRACESARFIDYSSFWRFKEWTQEFVKREGYVL